MKRPFDTDVKRSPAPSLGPLPAKVPASSLRISVLGSFGLVDVRRVAIPVATGTKRLLSLLAIRGRVVQRGAVAGALWPDVSEGHAHASLRSALLRIPPAARAVVAVTDAELSLADDVAVDVRDAQSLALRLLDSAPATGDADLGPASILLLSSDLLPGWRDEWVTSEAEEWRQLRLHALEAFADRLVALARFGAATVAAMAAVRAEPLRESAHAALIRVHIAEGNQSEALRQYERYRTSLRHELGIEPTARLRSLLGI